MTVLTTQSIESQCQKAYEAAPHMGRLSTQIKNDALVAMADQLEAQKSTILEANKADLENGKAAGLSTALLDRLKLTPDRIKGMADSLRQMAGLADPIGEIVSGWRRPNGLQISKVRVPLGVVGIIYEARPNVTADAVGLCVKTGNCVVLRGSSSAYQSNSAISTVLTQAAEGAGIPKGAIQLLSDVSREGVDQFLKLNQFLDMIIPRGGAGLIQHVVQTATVPTIETGVGNCHVYIDASADPKAAITIAINAKTHRPSVCNAAESILVHADIAPDLLPKLAQALQAEGVEVRGCDKTLEWVPNASTADPSDWETEYLDLIVAIKVVDTLDAAIDHIRQYGSRHTEAICATDVNAIQTFKQEVDAAAIVVNASTRFTDGGEFGYGAEMGISTQKLHARGPMGLPELTTIKYWVEGSGQIRT